MISAPAALVRVILLAKSEKPEAPSSTGSIKPLLVITAPVPLRETAGPVAASPTKMPEFTMKVRLTALEVKPSRSLLAQITVSLFAAGSGRHSALA